MHNSLVDNLMQLYMCALEDQTVNASQNDQTISSLVKFAKRNMN
jgi:hypothetical protein